MMSWAFPGLAHRVIWPEGDPRAGKPLAYTCLGCHGIEGYRNAYPSYRVPKLGGQKAAYLVAASQLSCHLLAELPQYSFKGRVMVHRWLKGMANRDVFAHRIVGYRLAVLATG